MITDETYLYLKRNYSDCSSWALWNHKDLKQDSHMHASDCRLDPFDKLLEDSSFRKTHLNSNAIYLGLNFSERDEKDITPDVPWSAFHDITPRRTHDYNSLLILQGTKFEGCYMTDLIKNHRQTKGPEALRYIKKTENRSKLIEAAHVLQDEIDHIKPKFIFTCGNDTNNLFQELLPSGKYKLLNIHDARVEHITHWSSQQASRDEYLAINKRLRQF